MSLRTIFRYGLIGQSPTYNRRKISYKLSDVDRGVLLLDIGAKSSKSQLQSSKKHNIYQYRCQEKLEKR